jgi:hypothetical protein
MERLGLRKGIPEQVSLRSGAAWGADEHSASVRGSQRAAVALQEVQELCCVNGVERVSGSDLRLASDCLGVAGVGTDGLNDAADQVESIGLRYIEVELHAPRIPRLATSGASRAGV